MSDPFRAVIAAVGFGVVIPVNGPGTPASCCFDVVGSPSELYGEMRKSKIKK